MWFERLVGFREDEVADVAAMLDVVGESLTSRVNGRTMACGRFEAPTLHGLRRRVAEEPPQAGSPAVREVVADVQQLHLDPAAAGAVFQVASQFNALEMVSPSVTPEDGVDRYEGDNTQGPACAIACGAGTIYRNYLLPVGGRIGQSADRQLDCLADLAAALGVEIEMRNGYALPTGSQLATIGSLVGGLDPADRDRLLGELRIGLHHRTEVTLGGARHLVTQAYCSALPIAYGSSPAEAWEPFARLVLDAAYEATVAAAVVNARSTGNRAVHLTLLGGGVFGNPVPWIISAIERALAVHAGHRLDVRVVSHGRANPTLGPLLSD